jgi:hypothetical protein
LFAVRVVSEHVFVMTRPVDEVTRCLELSASGLNPTEISRATGIPRPTVRDWVEGRVPRGHEDSPFGGCAACGQAEHVREAFGPEYAYLLGAYLGDGCISAHPRGVFRLRIVLDAAYPKIIDEVARAVAVVRPRNRVGRVVRKDNCVEISSYSRSWPCLLPQHGPGRKHERPIRLQAWQWMHVEDHAEAFLRGLIHSDGHRFINTGRGWRHPRYGFTNASYDIRHIFCEACDLLGLRWTRGGERVIYVSRKADVARMDEFIGPKA